MSTTAQNKIDEVLKLLGVVSDADTPDSTQRNTCLTILNDMLDGWNGEGLLMPYRTTASYTLQVGVSSYTIGPSGVFNVTPRPIDLEFGSAMLRDSNNQDIPISVVAYEDYEHTVQKSLSAAFPQYVAYQKLYPLGKIWIWPVPANAFALRLTTIYQWAVLALSDAVDAHPGTSEAIKWNLTQRVGIHYRRQYDPKIDVFAEQALRELRRNYINKSATPMASAIFQGARSTYNINKGY